MLIFLIIIAIINRLGLTLWTKTNFDTYGHLYFIKEIKTQKVGPFDEIETKVSGSKKFKSQFLWHWFLSFLPTKFLNTYHKYINPILDILFSIFIYLITLNIGYKIEIAFQLSVLYLFTPLWFSRFSIGPRVKSLTPRLLSEILTTIFFMVTILPLKIDLIIQSFVSVFLGSIVILSFRFGLQAILFISIIFAIFSLNLFPLLTLVVSIFLSVLISRGKFIETLKFQAVHLKWYFKKNLKGEMSISNRNNIRFHLNKLKEGSKRVKFKDLISIILINNSIGSIILKLPLYIFILFFTIRGIFENVIYFNDLFYLILSGTIIFFVVSTPLFLFIGEAERYLSHISYFIILNYLILVKETNFIYLTNILIFYGVIYWIFEIGYSLKKNLIKSSEESNLVFNYIENLDKKIILAFPYHAIGGVWKIMLNTKHEVVCHMASDKDYRNYIEQKYSLKYPYLNLNLVEEMHIEFGLNLIIIEKNALDKNGFKNWAPPPNWTTKNLNALKIQVIERL
ncbi:hypothetical protein N9313_01490 [Flavobacteriaceae bacterium]|nr:hypothetical protein [Flavobacteriaceae bacterium]